MLSIARKRVPWIWVMAVLGFSALILTTLYTASVANVYASSNSDYIVYPYLFKPFYRHDILLPIQHANILKFPLFALQALLPYNYTTLTIVDIGLLLITTVGWALILTWLFGKKYVPLICLTIVSLLLGSTLLNIDLVGTTLRNIEYPIVLLFMVFFLALLQKKRLRIGRPLLIVVGFLYALTLAGDNFFLYIATFEALILLTVAWLFNKRFGISKRALVQTTVYVAVFTITAISIKPIVRLLGIADFYTNPAFKPRLVGPSHLLPTIHTALDQLLNLCGANIFTQNLGPTHFLALFNFILLLMGTVGLLLILVNILKAQSHNLKDWVLVAASLLSLLVFLAYMASDQVVTNLNNGQIVSANQERYLTIVPFLLVIGVAYLGRLHLFRSNVKYWMVAIPFLVVFLINAASIKHSQIRFVDTQQSEIKVAQIAQVNHLRLLLTGYWYGSSVRFWSKNEIDTASIANCNVPSPPFNNLVTWYEPTRSSINSGLVIDRHGIDQNYWLCSDDQLVAIYGPPIKVIGLKNQSLTIWLYNYDLRARLAPISF